MGFVSGDRNLTVAGMERDWPEGRGIYHNEAKTFLLWVNEEDQTRIISMEKGGDVKGVFARLARGIAAVGDSVKAESGKDFALSEQYGYIHSCPTNLGTGMRASVMIDLPATPRLVLKSSRPGARSWLSSPVAPVESPVASMAAPMTCPTSTGWDTPRFS